MLADSSAITDPPRHITAKTRAIAAVLHAPGDDMRIR
jgi:hypothetical protein